MAEASGRSLDLDDLRCLSLILLVQMSRPEFSEALAREPSLINDYNMAVERPDDVRDEVLTR